MIVGELTFAFLVALLLSLFFALIIGKRRDRAGFALYFVIIFLATWAGGIWIYPFGPTLFGIHWIPFILVALIVALILESSAPRAPRGRHDTLDMLERISKEKQVEKVTFITLGTFFWILLIALVFAIILRYLVG